MLEPGLDRHGWESEWASLEGDLADSPADALPELRGLVERMLKERGVLDYSAVPAESADPELVRSWEQGTEVAERVERGEPVDPGDVGQAVENFRGLYETLLSERSAP